MQTMSTSWSGRRKTWYAVITIVVIVLAIGLPTFFTFYKAPTCFDGKRNGGEGGVDCGGSCSKLCSSSFVPAPQASWVRMKEASPGYLSVAAYLVNPNPKGIAKNVPYDIDLVDSEGITISKVSGAVTLPPGRNTLAFKTGVPTGKREIVRAVFKYTGEPDWILAGDPLALLITEDKKYSEDTRYGSSLEVTFRNPGSNTISNVTVYAILKDKDNNVIDFSKTILDDIPAHKTAVAPFTWPLSHNDKVISIEVLPVAE